MAKRSVTLDCPCGGYVRIDTDAVVYQSHGAGCALAPMPDRAWLAVPDKWRSRPQSSVAEDNKR